MWTPRRAQPLRAKLASAMEKRARMDLEGSFEAVLSAKEVVPYKEAKASVERGKEQEEAGFPQLMEQYPVLPGLKKAAPAVAAAAVVEQTPVPEEPEARGEEVDPHAVTPMTTFGFATANGAGANANEFTAVMSKIGHALECRMDPPTWKARDVADRSSWKKFLKE